jgi:2-C-methyl-D-erythritol 4-phosphate cytidylyltransferase/2-C-methyl-D-erythritol 2,4-cyclodiphosphate synthase
VAARAGRRFGGELPKVFAPVAGAPLVAWSLRAYGSHPQIEGLCLVAAPEYLDEARRLCATEVPVPWLVAPGGVERRQSVRNGLLALAGWAPDLVAIHDGARPLVTREMVSDGLRVAGECGAAVAAYPSSDTVKRTRENGTVTETLDRSTVYLAQTPQTFCYSLIRAAHERAEADDWAVTDDAVLCERLGHEVRVSQGHPRNLKVTVPEDLAMAEWLLLGATHRPPVRIGHGFDLHRLVEGRRLTLGGVQVPYERGLLGHSDADAALHAVCDALLGACALGDIGLHFPDTDPAYAGADSRELARQVAALVREAGWAIGNVDVTILAQEPRLAPHVQAMREATARALGCEVGAVSYKATTTERLGPIGEGQAIAAEAVACMVPLGTSGANTEAPLCAGP